VYVVRTTGTPPWRRDALRNWPKKILAANAAFMEAFTKKVNDAGELVAAEALGSPEEAKRVRAGSEGKLITDGAFAESKEYLAGYWIVDVDSPERALALAGEVSKAPGVPVKGADGKPVDHFWIEVRQVLGGQYSRTELPAGEGGAAW
jgi:hypothetical protein